MDSEQLRSADWLTLTDDETIEWTGRPSLFTLAPQFGGAIVVAIVGAFGISVLDSTLSRPIPGVVRLLPLLAALSILAVVLLKWYRVRYVITSNEVYIKRGLISLDLVQIRLSRIQNTTRSQSIVERLLGYGDVVAYTAGTDTMDIELRNVPNPSQVNETLSRLLSRSDNEQVRI